MRGIFLSIVILSGALNRGKGSDAIFIGNGKMPDITADKNNRVQIIYGKGDSLMYSFSQDQAKSFSRPKLIELIPGLNASAMRGPQINVAGNALIVVGTTEDGRVFSKIRDKANQWHPSITISDHDSVAMEGFVSVASDGNTVCLGE